MAAKKTKTKKSGHVRKTWAVPPGQPSLSITPKERQLMELMKAAQLAEKPDIVEALRKRLGERLDKRLAKLRTK